MTSSFEESNPPVRGGLTLDQDLPAGNLGFPEDTEEAASGTGSQIYRGPWVLPAILGVVLLAMSIYYPTRPSLIWAFNPAGDNLTVSSNIVFVTASVLTGLLLLIYAIRLRRWNSVSPESRNSAATFAIPVALWFAGMFALAIPFILTASAFKPANPSCVELYADMVAVAQQSPGFRLSPSDPDEARCGINKAIFG
jgi:hypothetical protein